MARTIDKNLNSTETITIVISETQYNTRCEIKTKRDNCEELLLFACETERELWRNAQTPFHTFYSWLAHEKPESRHYGCGCNRNQCSCADSRSRTDD